MPVTIKYIGTSDNYAELPVTGKQSIWQIGQQEERPDNEASLLMATGLFYSSPVPVFASTNLTGGISLSAAGVPISSNNTPAVTLRDASGRILEFMLDGENFVITYTDSGGVATYSINGGPVSTLTYGPDGLFTGVL